MTQANGTSQTDDGQRLYIITKRHFLAAKVTLYDGKRASLRRAKRHVRNGQSKLSEKRSFMSVYYTVTPHLH